MARHSQSGFAAVELVILSLTLASIFLLAICISEVSRKTAQRNRFPSAWSAK
jgi:hypothetical protein